MDKDKLNQFYKGHKSICLGLNQWLQLKAKDFKLIDALDAIYRAANGKESEMEKMIIQLIEKNKARGRSQVYHTDSSQHMDIVKGEDGVLKVTGYVPGAPEPARGQKERNPKIFRKGDGQVKKTVQKTEDRLYDIGAEVRKLYPNSDVDFLAKAIRAIADYAALKKKKPSIIVNRIKNGRAYLDTNTFEVKSKTNESRTIIISEKLLNKLSGKLVMSDYVFESNIRQFLADLYNDPSNAQPSDVLKMYGFTRNELIRYLVKYDIITKKQKVSFKDENGNFKTPTMKVRYGIKGDKEGDFEVKKRHFQLKIRKLYIDLFEKNVPQKVNEDEGGGFISGGGDGAGQYTTPIFGQPVKQKGYLEKTEEIEEATTTSSVGNYTYDMPAFSDKETRDRKGGKNHSVSINFK